MTDMIQIDRTKLIDSFAQFIASAEPATTDGMIDVQTIAHLAEKGRELAADGAFRNKTTYSETLTRLERDGYSEADIIAIAEIGLQIGRAVNAAFMNAAGVYSGTAKLLRAFEKQDEAANDEREAIEAGVELPYYGDEEINQIMAEDGMVWDELLNEYVPADLKERPANPVGVAAAIERVAQKYALTH